MFSANTSAALLQTLLVFYLTLYPLQVRTQNTQGANPYFAAYLLPGELADGSLMPLFQEVWRVMGYQLTASNFTTKVSQVSQDIFAAYSYHGEATGLTVSAAAPTYVDDQPGALTNNMWQTKCCICC